MKQKNLNIILLLIFIISVVIMYNIINYTTNKKIEHLKYQKYSVTASKMREDFEVLIEEKQKATLAIALLLAKNDSIKNALINNKYSNIDLKVYSGILKEHSDYKNIWFQIVDRYGKSVSRSWTSKKGDYVLDARIDLVKVLKEKVVLNNISVGKFDLTFKSTVPILDNSEIIGIFEAITHFNSITKSLLQKKVDIAILVDKKYKKQLLHPFSKIFIEDYYVANKNANKKLLNIIKDKKVEFFKDMNKSYYIDEKSQQLITVSKLYDVNNNPMSYAVLFKSLKNINISKINQLKTNMTFYIIMFILIFAVIIYYFASKKYHKYLKDEHNRIKTILDTQPDIMVITNGDKLIDANKQFFNFFDEYKSLDKFVKKHNCICDLFEEFEEEHYIKDKIIDNEIWIDYIVNNNTKPHKVAIKKDGVLEHFIVKASQINIGNDDNEKFIVIVLINITNEIKVQEEIEHKNKLILEQSKMVSMGEMIGNIAHQWRQPLSVITTAATGMQMEKEFGILSDEKFIKTCELINKNAQYLSKTIDDFKNFIKGDKTKKLYNLNENINSFLHLVEASSKNNNISVILDLNESINIDGYENELTQCLINIFNNAKDALNEHDIEEKYIFITTKLDENNKNAIIEIKDNAGGIPNDILPKIFEAYFTTKHQSQGTGLGLNMTYKLITEGMNGTIEAVNTTYLYKNKKYSGAMFIITLPLS